MASGGAPNPNPWRPPKPEEGYPCPFCEKWWPTAQALGGHMSSRSCLKNRRENAQVSHAVLTFLMLGPLLVVLAPNQSFWEEYRRGGPRPVEINFMGLAPAYEGDAAELLEDAIETEVDGGAGEEVDLTLKL